MTNKIRNEFAACGLEILKRSVLLVLYEENLGEELQPDKIRERLGMPPLPPYHGGAMSAATMAILPAVTSRLCLSALTLQTAMGFMM